MAMNIDFFPSILSLLEIPLPNDRQIDGKNMMPILEGGKSEHEVVYYTSAWTGEISGVRNQRYKYHTKGLSTAIPMYKRFGMVGYVKPQLNDLLLDNESHNLIKKHPNQAKDLKSKLDEKSAELEANPRGWIDN
jgi:arylsulfatase A-like enzyme